MVDLTLFQILATFYFVIALIHTFLADKLNQLANRFADDSWLGKFLYLLGKIELIFGFWSILWLMTGILVFGFEQMKNEISDRDFNQAIFIIFIMAICSTRPVLIFSENILIRLSQILYQISPINKNLATYFIFLFVGPLLGSFITEPAAMTITAYLLLPRFFNTQQSTQFKYATIALLFVNISIGGTLTPYAAPPVLMVAQKWGWDLTYMLLHFAPKTILALLINILFITTVFRKEIAKIDFNKQGGLNKQEGLNKKGDFWNLKILRKSFFKNFSWKSSIEHFHEPVMVGIFIVGLIILGGAQAWWLEPLIGTMTHSQLFFGAIGLTSIIDNAALTYLGSLVNHLDDQAQFLLVSGSVIGGGLTIIANAPNPVGFGILKNSFRDENLDTHLDTHLNTNSKTNMETNFKARFLFYWALPLTLISTLIFYV